MSTTLELTDTPNPGIYLDVDFETYVGWDAVNASTLKGFTKPPAHVRHDMESGGKEQTKAMRLGSLLHRSIFEPEKFAIDVVVPPKIDKRYNEGKAKWVQFQAEHPNKEYVDPPLYTQIIGITEGLKRNESTKALLFSGGSSEVSIVWTERKTGLLCKARIDHLGPFNEWPLVVSDLKTTFDASRRNVERQIHNYGYHISAAHYLDGLETLQPVPAGDPFRRFMWAFVESKAPYCAAAYEITDEALAQGLADRDRFLLKWKECTESGDWHGYPPGVEYAGLPAYAYRQYEDFND